MKRYLGTYFRVGFFGDQFDIELQDKQFIYKAPQLTSLAEFAPQLMVSQHLNAHVCLLWAPGSPHLWLEPPPL